MTARPPSDPMDYEKLRKVDELNPILAALIDLRHKRVAEDVRDFDTPADKRSIRFEAADKAIIDAYHVVQEALKVHVLPLLATRDRLAREKGELVEANELGGKLALQQAADIARKDKALKAMWREFEQLEDAASDAKIDGLAFDQADYLGGCIARAMSRAGLAEVMAAAALAPRKESK